MGRPAASADVQRSGRSAPVRRSKVAAFEACQPSSVRLACQNSWILPFPGSTTMMWRSPSASRWNCSSVWPGLGRALVSSLRCERPVLDGGVVGHRERPGVGLVRVVEELDLHPLLVGGHDDEAHVEVVPERLVGPDAGDDPRRVRVHGQRRDVLVPRVVGREDLSAARIASASGVSNITGFVIFGIGGRAAARETRTPARRRLRGPHFPGHRAFLSLPDDPQTSRLLRPRHVDDARVVRGGHRVARPAIPARSWR